MSTVSAAAGVTGCILAGGRGSRLGGRDKGLAEIGGRALVAYVAARLAPQVERVLISANRNAALYRAYAEDIVADEVGDFAGPLAGMAAALAACSTPSIAFVPCDSPLLPLDLVVRLREARDAARAAIAVVRSGARLEPVFALLEVALLPDLSAFIAAGGRKIDAWYARHPLAFADYPADDPAFMNVNTPEELARGRAAEAGMKELHDGVPVLGFVAASGTGKTTLMGKLIAELGAAGLRVGCVKHTHHPFEIDHPGKDSHALRAAGAAQVLLGSPRRWALIVEDAADGGDTLEPLLARLELARLDLVLVEGFKLGSFPKIEVQRTELAAAPLYPHVPGVIALATNARPAPRLPIAVFDLDDPAALAAFILQHVARVGGLRAGSAPA